MRAEVVEESCARAGNFAPPVTDLRPKAVEAGFEHNNSSHEILPYCVLDGEKIAVPAPVLEYRQEDFLLSRDSREISCFTESNGERLVHHDVAAGAHRQLGEWRVGFVGTRNYYEVD